MTTRSLLGASVFCAALAGAALVGSAPVSARSLPALDRRVVDEAVALEPAARVRLESNLADYERRTGHQFAVVILRGLDGDVLEQLSLRAAEQWRLGDKRRDDGLLVVVAMKERAVRIEVGYGLEGVVTDALASRIIRDAMAPRFAAGDVIGGLEAGISALMRASVGESALPEGTGSGSTVRRPSWTQLLPLVVFAAMVILSGIARRRGGRGHGGGGGLLALGILMSALGGGRGGHGGGGGFSGGGGGFGGGGASGRW